MSAEGAIANNPDKQVERSGQRTQKAYEAAM